MVFLGGTLLSFAAFVAATTSPIVVKSTKYIANSQNSTNDKYVVRDAGAHGSIGGVAVQIYADTSQCPNESETGCNIVAANTIAKDTSVPYRVTDYGITGKPQTFCTTAGTNDSSSDRLHLGNLVPTGAKTGAIWYVDLSNDLAGCNEIDGCPVSNGVAAVKASTGGAIPSCSAHAGYWDVSSEPMWGTSAAFGSPHDNYIYLMGQLDGRVGGSSYNDVYLARVLNGSQFTYSAYEYWNGTTFTKKRLVYPNYQGYAPSAILTGIEAFGSAYYNKYYNQFIVLAANKMTGDQVLAYSAPAPQGPWSSAVSIYQNSSIGYQNVSIYLPEVLPNFDPTGKTMTFVWSLFGINRVNGVVKATFA